MTKRVRKQARPTERVIIDAKVLRPFEIGAQLDALLCYPTWSAYRRQGVADAICATLVAHSIEVDPSRKAELWEAFPKYTMRKSRASLKTRDERRKEALNAGLAFLPLLKKAAIGELPVLRGRAGELSLAEIARFLWPDENSRKTDYNDLLHDRMKHGLRRFYPIAHLAAANQYIARERSGDHPAAPFDYQDTEHFREVVRRADEYAGYFAAMPRWGNIAEALIRIEWRE